MLRVSAYAFFVLFTAFLVSFHSAKADAANGALEFGRKLSPLADAIKLDGDIAPIALNEQRVFISHATATEDPNEVLDRFESHCAGDAGALGALWQDVSKNHEARRSLSAIAPLKNVGVLRSGNSREGTVMCLVKGTGTPASFADAVKTFVRTSDLGALGKLRYAYVSKGEAGGSRVVTAWTEDSFNFNKLFPPDGSEPAGADPAGVGRVPGSKRLMSAVVEGSPFSLRVYRSHGSPEQAVEYYEKTFDARGWMRIARPAPNMEARAFLDPGGSMVVVSAAKDPDSEDTLVSFGELGIPAERPH